MDENPRYLNALQAAKAAELAGDMVCAVAALERATHLTRDDDELHHLNVWQTRLKRQTLKLKPVIQPINPWRIAMPEYPELPEEHDDFDLDEDEDFDDDDEDDDDDDDWDEDEDDWDDEDEDEDEDEDDDYDEDDDEEE